MSDFPRAARIDEFCDMFRISISTFHKYVRLGKIETTTICGRTLVLPAELERISREGIRYNPPKEPKATKAA